MNRRIRIILVCLIVCFPLARTFTCDEGTYVLTNHGFYGFWTDANLRITALWPSVPNTPAARAGLQLGDRIDRRSTTFETRLHLFGAQFPQPGERMTLRILGTPARTITVVSSPFEHLIQPHAVAYWIGDVTKVIMLVLAGLIVVVRPSLLSWTFFIYGAGLNGPVEVFCSWTPAWVNFVAQFFVAAYFAAACGSLLTFSALFGHPRPSLVRRWIAWAALPASLWLLFTGFWESLALAIDISTPNLFYEWADHVVNVIWLLAVMLLITTLIRASAIERRSMRWLVAAIVVGGFIGQFTMDMFWPAPGWQGDLLDLGQPLLESLLPVGAAYAILWHRAFDLGFFANRAIGFGVLIATASVAMLTVDWSVATVFGRSNGELALDVALAFAAGAVITVMRPQIIASIDRLFRRRRYESGVAIGRLYEDAKRAELSLEAFATEVARMLDLPSLAIFGHAADGGFVRTAAVGWNEGTAWHILPGDALAHSLSVERSVWIPRDASTELQLPKAAARPSIALALRSGKRVDGCLLVAPPTGHASFDREEAQGLVTLFVGVVNT